MRLLNTNNLQFAEFFDSNLPEYLILSHRWRDQECTYQSFCNWRKLQDVRVPARYITPGIRKVMSFCRMAHEAGYVWVWIDTCCIDKTNSTELNEAINSMWHWYQRAASCCVFLDDVRGNVSSEPGNWNGIGSPYGRSYTSPHLSQQTRSYIYNSEWFTRGWCLQELLAPAKERFFDCEWRYLGHRDNDQVLTPLISRRTGISPAFLKDPGSCRSVAEKMSWAAGRVTSRPEDRAYSLLGLFNVSLPLLYGEGPVAFERLQKAIIEAVDDESIFAWWSTKTHSGSILASDPDDFKYSAGIYPVSTINRPPPTITSRGVLLEIPPNRDMQFKSFLMRLNCRHADNRPVYVEMYRQQGIGIQLFCRTTNHPATKDYMPMYEAGHDSRVRNVSIYLPCKRSTLEHLSVVEAETRKRPSAKQPNVGQGGYITYPNRW